MGESVFQLFQSWGFGGLADGGRQVSQLGPKSFHVFAIHEADILIEIRMKSEETIHAVGINMEWRDQENQI